MRPIYPKELSDFDGNGFKQGILERTIWDQNGQASTTLMLPSAFKPVTALNRNSFSAFGFSQVLTKKYKFRFSLMCCNNKDFILTVSQNVFC
jgi:hypothetical protein